MSSTFEQDVADITWLRSGLVRKRKPDYRRNKGVRARTYKSLHERMESDQIDFTHVTLHGQSRLCVMRHGSEVGKGHPVYTDYEKKLLASWIPNRIIRGIKLSLSYVRGSIIPKLEILYPCFKQSLRDIKVVKSICYCLNYMTKNKCRQYLFHDISDYGPLADVETYMSVFF
jgi:hypothetical protein